MTSYYNEKLSNKNQIIIEEKRKGLQILKPIPTSNEDNVMDIILVHFNYIKIIEINKSNSIL